jgi:hypothetical protein
MLIVSTLPCINRDAQLGPDTSVAGYCVKPDARPDRPRPRGLIRLTSTDTHGVQPASDSAAVIQQYDAICYASDHRSPHQSALRGL